MNNLALNVHENQKPLFLKWEPLLTQLNSQALGQKIGERLSRKMSMVSIGNYKKQKTRKCEHFWVGGKEWQFIRPKGKAMSRHHRNTFHIPFLILFGGEGGRAYINHSGWLNWPWGGRQQLSLHRHWSYEQMMFRWESNQETQFHEIALLL